MSTHPLADTAWAVRDLVRSVAGAKVWLRQRRQGYLDAREKRPRPLVPIDLLGDPDELGLGDEDGREHDAGLTLDEKAALLVALYDEVCVGEEKLAPVVRVLRAPEIPSAENRGVMCWEALRRTVRDQLGDGYRQHAQSWLADVRQALCGTPTPPSADREIAVPTVEQLVTLDQMAAVTSQSKRTLEKWKTRKGNPLPPPDVEGGGGKADKWVWSVIRPWLEDAVGLKLPERYPADRFHDARADRS